MKIYNNKYLFIGILASLVTACGSGGSGGSNSLSNSKPSSLLTSKPATDVSLPANLGKIAGKVEEKLKVPIIQTLPGAGQPNARPNSGGNSKPNQPASADNKVNSAPRLEETKPIQPPKPNEVKPAPATKPKKEEVVKPETKPKDKMESPKSEVVKPKKEEDNSVANAENKPAVNLEIVQPDEVDGMLRPKPSNEVQPPVVEPNSEEDHHYPEVNPNDKGEPNNVENPPVVNEENLENIPQPESEPEVANPADNAELILPPQPEREEDNPVVNLDNEPNINSEVVQPDEVLNEEEAPKPEPGQPPIVEPNNEEDHHQPELDPNDKGEPNNVENPPVVNEENLENIPQPESEPEVANPADNVEPIVPPQPEKEEDNPLVNVDNEPNVNPEVVQPPVVGPNHEGNLPQPEVDLDDIENLPDINEENVENQPELGNEPEVDNPEVAQPPVVDPNHEENPHQPEVDLDDIENLPDINEENVENQPELGNEPEVDNPEVAQPPVVDPNHEGNPHHPEVDPNDEGEPNNMENPPADDEENIERPPLPDEMSPYVPLTKNSGVLDLQKNGMGLIATDRNPNIPAVNEETGVINVKEKYPIAILSIGKNSKGINKGTINGEQLDSDEKMSLMVGANGGNLENSGNINGTGSNMAGMSNLSSDGEGFTSTNNGRVNIYNNDVTQKLVNLIGMEAYKTVKKDGADENITLTNNNNISVRSEDYVSIESKQRSTRIHGMSMIVDGNSKAQNEIINNRTISIIGNHGIGMYVDGNGATATNKGSIKSEGENSAGMYAFGYATAINEGTINTIGNNSVGIRVSDNSLGINEKTGTIKVDGANTFGMTAINGSKIVNRGKIVLATDISTGMYAGDLDGHNVEEHGSSSIVNEGEIRFEGFETFKRAIWTTGTATYVNKGKIIDYAGMEIKIEDKAKFIVGKEASGDVARVRSRRSLRVDGNVVASKDLIEGNKKEIIYSDVFSAPKVELVRATDPKAVSLFYNSKLALNKSGNADMLVYRNEATVEKSYENTEFKSLTSSLDRYLNIQNMNMSDDEKLVIDRVLKADSVNDVRKVVKNLSGEVYANLPRQVFDIQDRFIKEDLKLIDNLNEHSYNFNFFGDKTSVEDKGEISGYKSTSGGFVGTKKFQNNLYATIGYENSDIKYSEGSKDSIQSIHTGIYKKLSLNKFNIDLGLNGEYNFHETNREIDSFNVRAKGKYNSYTLGANGEISKVYGESLYFKPSAGLNLGYGQYEKFTEKNAGDLGLMVKDESYFSIVPKVEFKVGKNFEFIDIYSNIIYSYELGDLNKKQGMSLLGDKVHYTLNSDSLEKVSLAANLGISTEIKDFKVTLEVGKEFGKRENNYLVLGVGYKF